MAESTYLILSSFEYFTGTNVRFDKKKKIATLRFKSKRAVEVCDQM